MIATSRTAASAASLPAAPAAIFALLGLIDIALLGVVGSAVAPPPGVSIIIAGLGLVTLVALIPARHGSGRLSQPSPPGSSPRPGSQPSPPGLSSPRAVVSPPRARPAAPAAPAAGSLTMARIRLILVGAVLGLTWAAALRGYMMQLAGRPRPSRSAARSGSSSPPAPSSGRYWDGPNTSAALAAGTRCSSAPRCCLLSSRACSRQDSTLLRWAWPCLRWSGATPCPAVARSGFGAWPASSLPAPSSLRLPRPSRTRTSASPHRTAPGPPRWPRPCSWRSPWPAPYQCAHPIPFRHRANPGRPARI